VEDKGTNQPAPRKQARRRGTLGQSSLSLFWRSARISRDSAPHSCGIQAIFVSSRGRSFSSPVTGSFLTFFFPTDLALNFPRGQPFILWRYDLLAKPSQQLTARYLPSPYQVVLVVLFHSAPNLTAPADVNQESPPFPHCQYSRIDEFLCSQSHSTMLH
jgi:hypothetical protein